MAGCSIVMLMILLWPVMLAGTVVVLLAWAAAEFVMSPAFVLLIGSMLCNVVALADAGRVLWRRYRAGTLRELQAAELRRAFVLVAVAFVLFVGMCVLSASMVLAFVREIQTSPA